MRKAAHYFGSMDSSNSRRWRGERLHHHGDGVCLLFVLFVPSHLVVFTRHMYLDKYKRDVTSMRE